MRTKGFDQMRTTRIASVIVALVALELAGKYLGWSFWFIVAMAIPLLLSFIGDVLDDLPRHWRLSRWLDQPIEKDHESLI